MKFVFHSGKEVMKEQIDALEKSLEEERTKAKNRPTGDSFSEAEVHEQRTHLHIAVAVAMMFF